MVARLKVFFKGEVSYHSLGSSVLYCLSCHGIDFGEEAEPV